MVREHVDQIWVVNGSNFPEGWQNEASLVYESSFQLDFAAFEQWDTDFGEYTGPALRRAVDEGMMTAWMALGHDTGGPHTTKFVYYLEGWDQVDDATAFIAGVQQELGMTEESAQGVQAHSDNVWLIVPRRP